MGCCVYDVWVVSCFYGIERDGTLTLLPSSSTNTTNALNSNNNTKAEEKIDLKLSTVTLVEILDYLQAPQVMDYLSLDVEGGELHVMQHLLHNSHYTWLTMTVERPTEHLHILLHKHGYWMLTQLPLPHIKRTAGVARFGEIVYIHKTHPDFNTHMQSYRASVSVEWYGAQHTFLLTPAWPLAT